ncbi:hypothetical protein ACOACQ_13245 [Nocardioides sp. CPCC 206347]|uniref:hypothetical protein n=1 Tax=unclassified Nocardioides TaxID=2615069 RepID=UPI0036074EAD
MAQRLLDKGILPEDLNLIIRGRRASARLRGGEDSFANLVAEIREARSAPDRKIVRPDTKSVTRRPSRATPDDRGAEAG